MMNLNRLGKKVKMTCLLTAAAVIMMGCSKGASMMSDVKVNRGYNLPQTMMIVETEKNSYEDLYTENIWEVKVAGRTFDAYLLSQIRDFLEDMKIMNLLAEESGLTLTGEERGAMDQAANEYFDSLTEEDKAYMNLPLQDVIIMFEEYHIANKLVNELTRDVDLEVSDSEAKVISIMQLRTDSEEKAAEAYEKVSAEGADFQSIARDYNGQEKPLRLLGRGEENQEFEDVAFALQKDEISQVFQEGDYFYILKCVSDYDEEETKIRKDQIYTERKNQAFRQIYDDFKAGITLTYPDEVWSKVEFSDEKHGGNADFFEIYKKYSAL